MNLTFADINNTFQNLIQPNALPSRSGVFDSAEARPSLFADNLRQVIKDASGDRESVLVKSDVAVKKASIRQAVKDQAKNFFKDEMGQKQGLPFLAKLKTLFLTMSDGDLNNITMDVKGLDDLKKILLKNGFEPEEVEGLISGLTEKAQVKDISLVEVMDGLFKLSTDDEQGTMDEETLMETSALPFLTSLLNSLGLPKDAVSQILSQADRGENGISLEVVIDHLKSIEGQSIDTGQMFKTQKGDTSFTMLLENLGLAQPENTTAQLGVGDLISSLEKRKEKIAAAKNQADALAGRINQADGAVKESSNSLIDSLFKHFEIQSEKPGLAEFSYEQIKDQFKNDLLIPNKDQANKKGLFAQEQPGSIVKSEHFFKELESVLSGKSVLADTSKSSFKDGEGMTKFSKSESAKGGESLQMSASDIKTDFLGSALKAKAAFKNMPAYVMNQVEKSIVRAVNQGESTLKLQLKPAQLGRIVMTIDNVGNSMKVSITTENPVAKDILSAHVNELKSVLATVGISLDKFDVDMNSNFRQSMTDTKNQSDNSNRKSRNRENNLFDSNTMEGLDAGKLAAAIQNGSYHFVA